MLKPQALNYTPKAIEALISAGYPDCPLSKDGCRYLVDKLRQAEVFVLPDYGQLLDRGKPRPEVPSSMFRPSFPVVALEYPAPPQAGREVPGYTDAPCSRRIALAWDWQDDLPASFRDAMPPLGPGVVIASIAYYDAHQMWMPVFGGLHLSYDGEWAEREPMPYGQANVAAGRSTAKQLGSLQPAATPVIFLPEVAARAIAKLGGDRTLDMLAADVNDEANAFADLCMALACKNVSAERHHASKALNLCRKGRKPLLKDFHILNLSAVDGGGHALGITDRTAPRSHLRRGHIRRLGADRITWVNQTMVHGRGGFVDKAYAIGAAR